MKIHALVILAALLSSCGRSGKDEATPAAVAPAATPSAKPTRFPQPSATMADLRNGWAPMDVARHVARQERCVHWRAQRSTAPGETVEQGYARDCRGIDAELHDLRRIYEGDGRVVRLLRQFGPSETAQ